MIQKCMSKNIQIQYKGGTFTPISIVKLSQQQLTNMSING